MRLMLSLILGVGLLAISGAGAQPKVGPKLTPEQQYKLQRRDQLWADARAATKLADAIASGNQAMALEREVWGEKDPRLAASLETLAFWHARAEAWAEARAARKEALGLLTAAHGKDDWRATSAKLALADVDLYEKFTPGDRAALNKAAQQNFEGVQLANAGKWADARKPFEDALAARARLLGESHRDTLQSQNNVGLVLRELKDYPAAIRTFTANLELARKALGDAHPDVARAITGLGGVHERAADLAKAESFYRESLDLTAKIYGDAPASLAAARNDLARAYAKQGDAAKAEPLFRDAFEPLKAQGRFVPALTTAKAIHAATAKASGAGHADALAAAHRVGGLELLLGTPKLAAATLESALKAADANGPAKDELAARLANDLGVARYQLAKYKDAKDLFDRALGIRTEKLGEKHSDTLQSLRNLGWAEEALGNVPKGRDLLRKCYDALAEAAKDPALPPVSSAEAVLIREPQPVYPRIRIVYETRVPFGPPPPPPPPGDTEARVHALERLGLLKDILKLPGTYYASKAAEEAARLFGKNDYRYFVAAWNSGLVLQGAVLPAPFGPQHPVAASVQARAAAYGINWERGVAPAVIPSAEAAAQIRRRALGDDHPATAAADELVGLAKLCSGDLEAALASAEKVMAVRVAAHGDRHPVVATSLNVLGVIHYHRGDVARSRRLLAQSHAIRAEKLGVENVDTAAVASDLAILVRQQGDYATARLLLEEASKTLLKLEGPLTFATRTVTSNLRVVQLEMGDFAAPTLYYEEILAGDAPGYEKTQARLNLAAIARTRGDLKGARKFYQEALDAKKADPKLFLDEARVLNLLGATCRDLGDFAAAEQFLAQSLELRMKAFNGDRHPDTAFALGSIGLLHHARGNYRDAERAFEQSRKIYLAQGGPKSRNTAEIAAKLGLSRMMAGDLPKAREALDEALQIKVGWGRDELPNLPEADAMAFVAGLGELDPLLTVLSHTPGAAADAYGAVWATKGIATQALVARRIASEDSPEVRAASLALRQARAKLAAAIRTREQGNATYVADGPGYDVLKHDRPPINRITADYDKLLVELTAEKERCERELIRASASTRRRESEFSGSPADLAKVLPPNAAVVDFVRAKRWARKADGAFDPEVKDVYEAFVLKAVGGRLDVTRVDLGEAATIDKAVAEWREMFVDAGRQPRGPRKLDPPAGRDPALPSPDRVLRERVWDKVAPAVGKVETVIVIPDGALTRLPIAALPGSRPNTFLIEEVGVLTASYGQQVLGIFGRPATADGKTVLVGGVAYDAKQKDAADVAAKRGPAETRGEEWKYLPGTRREVDAIAELKPLALVRLDGADAGKLAVTRAAGTGRYLHVATHGFFADPKLSSTTGRRGQWSAAEGASAVESLTGRNPLVLSGLVLAGASAPNGRPGDGILTAEEIVDLDLSGAELVVLSACETGLGTVAGGEGVFGLQRAFALAGTRATVGSLWQVDDDATAALMVEFYRRLWDAKAPAGKLESLRAAQLAVLRGEAFTPPGAKKGDRVSPYYWAAFVLSGDPR